MVDLKLGDTELIIETAKKYGLLRNQAAYVLATAFWESASTMKPVKEAFWVKNAEEWRKRNLRYYPWYGRGYVQITWEENYKKASERIGRPWDGTAEWVMEPKNAAELLVRGSLEGWYRKGHTLDRYITLRTSDFFNAREIINGDKNTKKDGVKIGEKIATIAKAYDAALKEIGYGTVVTPIKEPEVVVNEKTTAESILEIIFEIIKKFLGK